MEERAAAEASKKRPRETELEEDTNEHGGGVEDAVEAMPKKNRTSSGVQLSSAAPQSRSWLKEIEARDRVGYFVRSEDYDGGGCLYEVTKMLGGGWYTVR